MNTKLKPQQPPHVRDHKRVKYSFRYLRDNQVEALPGFTRDSLLPSSFMMGVYRLSEFYAPVRGYDSINRFGFEEETQKSMRSLLPFPTILDRAKMAELQKRYDTPEYYWTTKKKEVEQ